MVSAAVRSHAQSPATASAFLPAGHWAHAAVRRVVGLGLVHDALLWSDGSLTRRAAAMALREAAASAERTHIATAPAVRGYWERYREEFPATAAALEGDAAPRQRLGEGWASPGLAIERGIAGTGYSDWRQEGGTGPVPLPDLGEPTAELVWAAAPWRHLALSAAPRYRDDWRSSEGFAYVTYKHAGLWGGRRAIGYGPAVGGGIIANPTSPVDGGGIVIDRARLPWILRHLGEIGFEGTLSRVDSNNAIKHPWLMLLHASLVPHPRLQLGANWGALFSGTGRPPFTVRNFFTMIKEQRAVSVTGEEFENQLVSIEARFRPPVSLPLVAYVEWGSEDNHSAWWDVPAIIGGVELMSVPRIPSLSLGLEHTYFDSPCFSCGTRGFGSNWYRHYIYKGGWAVDPIPLGHPLGGNGREWLASGRLDLYDARLRLAGRAFWRNRGFYNLFAPDREGRSVGAGLTLDYRLRPGVDLSLDALGEDGSRGWHQSQVTAAARFLF